VPQFRFTANLDADALLATFGTMEPWAAANAKRDVRPAAVLARAVDGVRRGRRGCKFARSGVLRNLASTTHVLECLLYLGLQRCGLACARAVPALFNNRKPCHQLRSCHLSAWRRPEEAPVRGDLLFVR